MVTVNSEIGPVFKVKVIIDKNIWRISQLDFRNNFRFYYSYLHISLLLAIKLTNNVMKCIDKIIYLLSNEFRMGTLVYNGNENILYSLFPCI